MIYMSMEVEAKAYCDDLSKIEKMILELGGEFQEEVEQVDIYFNHPLRDFAQTDEALRIRRAEDKATFTYKGPKIDSQTKTREELKVQLSDGDAMREVLSKLGFLEVGTVKKVRKKYKLNEFKVCLDDVKGLGSFVELEVEVSKDDQDEVSRLRDIILKTMKEWGLEKVERRSYLELLLESSK
jgi:adenylate cyclase class 2